jgi:DNA-binding transcriptional MocR family regulator
MPAPHRQSKGGHNKRNAVNSYSKTTQKNLSQPSNGFLKLFSPTCLASAERYVYAYLVWLDRRNKTASIRTIAQAVRLSRRTVTTSLKNLQNLKFVTLEDRKWKALQPPEGAIKTYKPKIVKHWSDEFVYLKLRMPKYPAFTIKTKNTNKTCELTLHHCELFSRLEGIAKKGRLTSKAGLARIMGLSLSTVKRLCNEFQATGLFRLQRVKSLSRIEWKAKEGHYLLFMPGCAIEFDPNDLNDAQRQIYDHCTTNKLHQHLAAERLQELIDLGSKVDYVAFLKLAKSAKAEHKANNGDLQYGNLLIHKLKQNKAADSLLLHQRNGHLITSVA